METIFIDRNIHSFKVTTVFVVNIPSLHSLRPHEFLHQHSDLLFCDSAALQSPLWPADATILAYRAFNSSFLQNQCRVGFFHSFEKLNTNFKINLLLSKWLRKQYYTDKYNNVMLTKNEHEYIKIQCVNKNTEKVIHYRKKKIDFPYLLLSIRNWVMLRQNSKGIATCSISMTANKEN